MAQETEFLLCKNEAWNSNLKKGKKETHLKIKYLSDVIYIQNKNKLA
jgi:hypothetical protein